MKTPDPIPLTAENANPLTDVESATALPSALPVTAVSEWWYVQARPLTDAPWPRNGEGEFYHTEETE
jgi:hypothetical protein